MVLLARAQWKQRRNGESEKREKCADHECALDSLGSRESSIGHHFGADLWRKLLENPSLAERQSGRLIAQRADDRRLRQRRNVRALLDGRIKSHEDRGN